MSEKEPCYVIEQMIDDASIIVDTFALRIYNIDDRDRFKMFWEFSILRLSFFLVILSFPLL